MKTLDAFANHPLPGHHLSGGEWCSFTAWAPWAERMDIRFLSPVEKGSPQKTEKIVR
jgi:hypothetical protein